MADEAFALSPIAARAALPSEADYDAIREAFMETSRGRWFLAEYARRNRNADTRMVLDAVARIEENLAAQNAVPEQRAAEILAALSAAVGEARAATAEAIARHDLQDALAPIRSGAQVIRGIISRLREIGADGRIYDLIETQVGTIEGACEQRAALDTAAALAAAFDLIDQRIGQLADPDSASSSAAAGPPSASVASATDLPAAPPQAATDTETALDEAVLDMIALEMAAPDFDEADITDSPVMETNFPEPSMFDETAAPVEPDPPAEPQPSLGASLIANGIVQKGETGAADPLAPLRRMSQAERIAFFS
jgi:hypothetical protein